MADIDVKQLTSRIDIVLDILVAGDHQSAIRNLEILKAELQQCENAGQENASRLRGTPWEV
ncbi:hypothetical protein KXR87_01690 [Yokenella regensburgei]|uniref:protein YciZ/DeoL n=1 Tax=Yokenella regensburgei TaxID=158877 RepID=UPI003F1718EA